MDLLDRVRATIRRHGLVRPGARVLVALSGGPDSVALTRILHTLAASDGFSLAGAAHLHHHLRPDAEDDVQFCADLTRSLGLAFEVGHADVRARAARDGVSIEAAGHAVRHEFLSAAARVRQADVVALGHTLDDQAETVLLRLIRGAGARGLAGMHPRRGPFIRPVLDVRRAELRAFLDAAGHRYRLDATNDDPRIVRNRVRADLLPLLERAFNPRIAEVLADDADVAREAWQWLDASATALLDAASQAGPGRWTVQAEALRRAPTAVAREALRTVMERAAGGRPIAHQHVVAALDLATAASTGPRGLDFPGHRMERDRECVVLTSRRDANRRTAATRRNVFAYSLSIPGEARVPEAGCTITAEVGTPALPVAETFGRGHVAAVQLSALSAPSSGLTVRNRRPGDRIRLPGMTGRKTLQDLFVDRKVARNERDRVPLVVDGQGGVVWVPGHSVGSEFRVTDPAQAVIILRLKLWGGSA